MALFVKQDFAPPILSRKWMAMKFRPNMLINSREHVISILESGLLFREDSIEVEQEAPSGDEAWRAAGGGGAGWLTGGERAACVAAVSGCVAVCPPRDLNRTTLFYLAAYLSLPIAIRFTHRRLCRGSLSTLLDRMRDYLTLARRASACLKECAILRADLGAVASALDSTRSMLCRQQSELSVSMSRASSALLGNAPWLRGDVAWDAVDRDDKDKDNLMKIHHAFLVVQSTLLKHIALAHFIPSPRARKMYKNHNERIYWIHYTLMNHLTEEFTQNYEALERMYRLLKNYGNSENNTIKKPGLVINDSWLYSDVHSDIARTNLELKTAVNKCNNLDMFLDSCALNKQEIDLEALSKDIDALIGNITKCLSTAQTSQIRLKKLLNKFSSNETQPFSENELIETEKNILKIEDREPETKDEVFYFIRTDDDDATVQPCSDVTTGPGKLERDATNIVLNELRRKLVNREDVMRERERQALVKTMPELKDNVPEFPRQIKLDEVLDKKGYISKLPKKINSRRLFRKYKIQSPNPSSKFKKYRLKIKTYYDDSAIKTPLYEANANLNIKSKMLSFLKNKNRMLITEWHKNTEFKNDFDMSDLSEGLSDVESSAANKSVSEAVNLNKQIHGQNGDARNYRFSKKELELSPSSTDTECDLDREVYKKQQIAILKDVRKHRAARKKNYPVNIVAPSSSTDKMADEGLKPVEYSFGARLAMASVLQVQSAARLNLPEEEIFTGDGELSQDSGNDEDA